MAAGPARIGNRTGGLPEKMVDHFKVPVLVTDEIVEGLRVRLHGELGVLDGRHGISDFKGGRNWGKINRTAKMRVQREKATHCRILSTTAGRYCSLVTPAGKP